MAVAGRIKTPKTFLVSMTCVLDQALLTTPQDGIDAATSCKKSPQTRSFADTSVEVSGHKPALWS
jgi:hypothetical protein